MAANPCDTLKYADRLEAAGVPRAQARIQAEALSEVFDLSELVTRDDPRATTWTCAWRR